MKNSAEYAVLLKKLCNKLKRSGKAPVAISVTEPTRALVLACLSETATESKAQTALNKLESTFVDYNELRVARIDEIVDILGKGFPQGKAVASQITSLLQQVYDDQDNLSLSNLTEGGKREAKSFLEKLNGVTPYTVSRTMLQGVEAHAFPVHDQLLEALRKEEVVHPDADAAEVQGFLERQIAASQIQKTYSLLRHFADSFKPKRTDTKSKKSTKSEAVSKVKKSTKTTATTDKTKKTTKKKKKKKKS